jgi:hypothetical protein
MHQINETDWKILRQLHSRALDSFCKRVLSEIKSIQEDTEKGPHEKYLRVWEVLRQRDKELAEIFNNPRRSTALMTLASMKGAGLLTDEDLLRLTPETREVIRHLLE